MKRATPSDHLNKLLVVFTLMILILISVYAKAGVPIISDGNKIRSGTWQQLQNNDQITINYRYADCELPANGSHNENVYLQIINKTNEKIRIEWDGENWYNGKCNGCEPGRTENHRTVILQPKETIEGSCSTQCNPALMITSKMLKRESKSELTDFNLRDLSVNPFVK
jgi:hypothetical protein